MGLAEEQPARRAQRAAGGARWAQGRPNPVPSLPSKHRSHAAPPKLTGPSFFGSWATPRGRHPAGPPLLQPRGSHGGCGCWGQARRPGCSRRVGWSPPCFIYFFFFQLSLQMRPRCWLLTPRRLPGAESRAEPGGQGGNPRGASKGGSRAGSGGKGHEERSPPYLPVS